MPFSRITFKCICFAYAFVNAFELISKFYFYILFALYMEQNVQKHVINYYNYSSKVTYTNISIVIQLYTPWSYLAHVKELVVKVDSRVRQ